MSEPLITLAVPVIQVMCSSVSRATNTRASGVPDPANSPSLGLADSESESDRREYLHTRTHTNAGNQRKRTACSRNSPGIPGADSTRSPQTANSHQNTQTRKLDSFY